MRLSSILRLALVWLGGAATVVLALYVFPPYLTPPPPACPAPGALTYEAAPFRFQEPKATPPSSEKL